MRAYTMVELQSIIDEVWARAFQTARSIHMDAPVPNPPQVHEVLDHPFTGSNSAGQYKKPWLFDPRGQRGRVYRT